MKSEEKCLMFLLTACFKTFVSTYPRPDCGSHWQKRTECAKTASGFQPRLESSSRDHLMNIFRIELKSIVPAGLSVEFLLKIFSTTALYPETLNWLMHSQDFALSTAAIWECNRFFYSGKSLCGVPGICGK